MITREQVEEAFGDNRIAFKSKDTDHGYKVISLLRERIPYEECKRIVDGAGHDIIYLCDVDKCLPYLNEEDLEILADCNCMIDSEYIALFV